MQLGQPFLKEVRSVQYLAAILVILTLMDAGITTVLHWNQMNTLASIVLFAVLGYNLFFLILAWQLGKRRAWMRKILLVLTYLGILGFWGMIIQLVIDGPIPGNILYKIYYYGIRTIYVLINASLAYYLTRPSARDTFQGKQTRTSASDIPQDAR